MEQHSQEDLLTPFAGQSVAPRTASPPVVAPKVTTALVISSPESENSIKEFLNSDPRELEILRVKLLPGGAGKFDIAEEAIKEFTAVVLDSHSINTHWTEGDNTFPDCFSMNGLDVHPQSKTPHAENCKVCPYGGFGGDCKRGMRLYLLTPDRFMPMIMNLPVTSTKPWRLYKTNLLYKNIKAHTVLTKFIAGPYNTKGGQLVTQVREELVSPLSKTDVDNIERYRSLILPKLTQRGIELEESTDFVGPAEATEEV